MKHARRWAIPVDVPLEARYLGVLRQLKREGGCFWSWCKTPGGESMVMLRTPTYLLAWNTAPLWEAFDS